MFFKRLTLVCALLVLLTGCSAISDLLPKSVERNVLSGREGTNGPVLAVKIDDTNAAHPQIGLEDADVVYIEQVEGGLTRLAAIFSSVIPERVGPVRSARISDIDILSQYGRVAFAYSGAQRKLLPLSMQQICKILEHKHSHLLSTQLIPIEFNLLQWCYVQIY